MNPNELLNHIKAAGTDQTQPLTINFLSRQLNMNRYDLIPHLVALRKLELIEFGSDDTIRLTDNGKENIFTDNN